MKALRDAHKAIPEEEPSHRTITITSTSSEAGGARAHSGRRPMIGLNWVMKHRPNTNQNSSVGWDLQPDQR